MAGAFGGTMEARSWQPLVLEAFDAEAIDALVARAVPYVHVPKFLDPAWCREVVRRFGAAIESLPDHQGLVMGPMTFDSLAKPVELFVDSPEPHEYFAHVESDAPRVRAVFAGGDDPLALMRRSWQSAGWTEVPATEGPDQRYHPDVVWGIREAVAPPHVDMYERDHSAALSRFPRRLNYNIYLQNPDSGGQFAVYDRWHDPNVPRVKPWLNSADVEGLFATNTRLAHQPEPGDLVIFDAMLYHEVTRVDGHRRRRVQLHSSLLADPAAREFTFFI